VGAYGNRAGLRKTFPLRTRTCRSSGVCSTGPIHHACLHGFGDEPVGGGALAVHEGVAAFYGASTLPLFRRRGVQKSIISALLQNAVEAGCDIAYTLTSPGSSSQRNVERQFFRVVYTRCTVVRDFSPE